MKKMLMLTLVLVLSVGLVLAGCSSNNNGDAHDTNDVTPPATNTDNNNNEQQPNDSNDDLAEETGWREVERPKQDISGEITVWSSWGLDSLAVFFNEEYPDVKVNLVTMDFDEMHEKLLQTLAAGSGAPDVAMVDSSWIGSFNTLDTFEDYLAEPYNIAEYRHLFSDYAWDRWLTLDGTQLIGVPWDTPPAVTFYRQDILDELGFPSEPEEVAEYYSDYNNFLNMAKTLKANDKYVLEWDNSVFYLSIMGEGYFDRDLNWVRNTDKFVQALDRAKEFKQEGLASYINFWSDEGNQALSSGKTVMFHTGVWGRFEIDGRAPDTAGKWRVTKLPMGAVGGSGGATLAIPSQGNNKLAAWEFVRINLLTNDYSNKEAIEWSSTPAYLPAYDWVDVEGLVMDIPELGDQKPLRLYQELIESIPVSVPTPLDNKAAEIFNAKIDEAIDKNLDSRTVLQQIEEEVMNAVAAERAALLEAMGR